MNMKKSFYKPRYAMNFKNAYIICTTILICILSVYIIYNNKARQSMQDRCVFKNNTKSPSRTDMASIYLNKKVNVTETPTNRDPNVRFPQNKNSTEEKDNQQSINPINSKSSMLSRIDKFLLTHDEDSLDAIYQNLNDIQMMNKEDKLALMKSLQKYMSEGADESVSQVIADLIVLDTYTLFDDNGVKPSEWFNDIMGIDNEYLQFGAVNMVLDKTEKNSYEWNYSLDYLKNNMHSFNDEMKAKAEALVIKHDPDVDKNEQARERLSTSDSIEDKMVFMEILDMKNAENQKVVADIFNDIEQPLEFRLRAMALYQTHIDEATPVD